MNSLSGIRLFRPWIKLRIAKPPSAGLHNKPPKDTPAPIQDEADESSTKQKKTRPHQGSPEDKARRSESLKRMWAQPGFREKRSVAAREVWLNLSPEEREKRSVAVRERWLNLSPEEKEKRRAIMRKVCRPLRRERNVRLLYEKLG
jgi:hypothetical protein